MMASRRETEVVGVEPWDPEWTTERAAEARLRESICMRRDGLPHTYPLHQHTLETMHTYYEEPSEIPPANGSYWWWVESYRGDSYKVGDSVQA
jgi:hypothetical protein